MKLTISLDIDPAELDAATDLVKQEQFKTKYGVMGSQTILDAIDGKFAQAKERGLPPSQCYLPSGAKWTPEAAVPA